MRRRNLIALLGGAAVAWPLGALSQQNAVVAVLGTGSPGGYWAGMSAAFRQGLDRTGYSEGRNVTIETRWALNLPLPLVCRADEIIE